jgi:type II secretory pathway component GspD/PulD (secretin)
MVLQQRKGRTVGFTTVAALSATMLAGVTTHALADDLLKSSTTNINVGKVEITGAPLPVAIKLITQKTGINVVFVNRPGQNFGTVDLSVNQKPVREVLNLVAQSAGAAFWEENGVYYIGSKEDAPKKTTPLLPVETPDAPAPKNIRYEKIKLLYISPQAVMKRLGIGNSPMVDIAEQAALKMYYQGMMGNGFSVTNLSSNTPIIQNSGAPSNFNSQPQPQINAAPAVPTNQFPTQANTADQGAKRDPGVEFGRAGGQGFPGGGFGGGGGQFGGGGGQFGGGGGQFGGQGGGQFGGQGGQGQGGNASSLLPEGITGGDILAFDADGSLIIRTGDEEALRQLKELIRLLDVKPKQIMVKAEFVTVTQNDVSSFGINWSLQKVNFVTGVQTGYQTANTAFIQYATGNVRTEMSWILTTGRGKLVAAPMATTLNNVSVSFFNQQNIPVFLSQPIIAQNGTVALAPQLSIFTAITGLNVLPRLNGDGTITLMGSVLVSDLGTPVTGPNGESAPTIITQFAPVQRIIRDGDTIVIGGLTSKNTTIASNRAPLLGDLPIIGTLFRSRQTVVRDSDLLVFITASVIPEKSVPTTLTGPGSAITAPTTGGGGLSQ